MGIFRGHREAYSRGPHGFLVAGDGKTGKGAMGWDLVMGKG